MYYNCLSSEQKCLDGCGKTRKIKKSGHYKAIRNRGHYEDQIGWFDHPQQELESSIRKKI